MVIDIAGTAGQFVKWVLSEILFLLTLLVFGLSAPLLFTVGIEALALSGADMRIWGVLYFLTGPLACAVWMVFVCHWHTMRQWQRAEAAEHLASEPAAASSLHSASRFGSWSAVSSAPSPPKLFFAIGLGKVFPERLSSLNPESAALMFAIAPLFVFAPVLLIAG